MDCCDRICYCKSIPCKYCGVRCLNGISFIGSYADQMCYTRMDYQKNITIKYFRHFKKIDNFNIIDN